jgi:hypothetical protein
LYSDLPAQEREISIASTIEPFPIEVFERCHLKLGDSHLHTLESWSNLIDLYETWNKPEEAEKWRAKLPRTENMNK